MLEKGLLFLLSLLLLFGGITSCSEGGGTSVTGIEENILITTDYSGDTFQINSPQVITWEGDAFEVEIELYKGDELVKVIASSIENSGTHNWHVPSNLVNSSDYKLKISDKEKSDISAFTEPFRVVRDSLIRVISPNSNTVIDAGLPINITWEDEIDENVKIELFHGDNVNRTVLTESTESDGSFEWEIPFDYNEGISYQIKITSVENSSIYSFGELFTINPNPYIYIITPNSNTVFCTGHVYEINWDDNFSEDVKVELYKGGVLNRVINPSVQSLCYYDLYIPSDLTPATDYQIKLTSVDDSSIFDFSDEFEIIDTPYYITVLKPNANSVINAGLNFEITWNNNFTENVRIELYKGDYLNYVITPSAPNTGSFNWGVASSLEMGTDYSIKISSINNNNIFDFSDEFEIINSPASIEILTPNSSNSYEPGNLALITWNDTLNEDVKIELYRQGEYYETIVESTESDGQYEWFIPINLIPETQYQIKISGIEHPYQYDISDYFTIFTSYLGDYEWGVKTGSVNNDKGFSIVTDSEGYSYITGYFSGTVQFGSTILTAYGEEIFLAKIDSNGNFIWAEKLGIFYGYSLDVDNQNNIYLTGVCGTIFISKFDSDGNIIWNREAIGGFMNYSQGVSVDSNGNSYITGTFSDEISFGAHTLEAAGDRDIFITKIDSNGNFIWAQQVATDDGIGFDIDVDDSGNSYITGVFFGFGGFGNHNLYSNGSDVFIAKLDSSGNFIWAKQAGGTLDDVAYAITLDREGNIYTTGAFKGYAIFGSTNLTSNGNKDIFISKLDPNGNFIWTKQAGGTGEDIARGICVDSDNNCYVTGQFFYAANFGSNYLTSYGDRDIFLSRLDSNGNFIWTKQAGGDDWDTAKDVSTDNSGNLYVTGSLSSGSPTNDDIFIAKFSSEQ